MIGPGSDKKKMKIWLQIQIHIQMQLSWRRLGSLRMPRPTFSKPQTWIGKVQSTAPKSGTRRRVSRPEAHQSTFTHWPRIQIRSHWRGKRNEFLFLLQEGLVLHVQKTQNEEKEVDLWTVGSVTECGKRETSHIKNDHDDERSTGKNGKTGKW